jgi:integrase
VNAGSERSFSQHGAGGKRGNDHISLFRSGELPQRCLDALKEKGHTIPFVLYDLRHTFATRAAQNGMPLLASVLGHSSLREVQKYVHPTQDHQATEMDRIDKIGQERKRQYIALRRSGPR